LTIQARYELSFKPIFHSVVAANCLSQFAATITLAGVKTTVQTAQTSEFNTIVWQKLQGAGSTALSVIPPTARCKPMRTGLTADR
jgi:cAMP phosphodiesterase